MSEPFEVVASGYQFCEAPRTTPDGGIWFSDLTGGGYHHVAADGSKRTVVPDRIWIGGATLDRQDALLIGGKGGLVLAERGETRPILNEIGGRPIVAVNDFEACPDGSIYGGTLDLAAVFERNEAPTPGHFFHLAPGGEPTLLRDDVIATNGIGFSPDGTTLYHAESTVGIWAWRMEGGRVAGRPDLFAKADDCDGLVVDAEGRVWVAYWRDAVIRRYRPDGVIDREIALPFPHLVSLCFGGPDLTDLYVTTGASESRPDAGGVIRMRSDVPGLPTHRSAFSSGA